METVAVGLILLWFANGWYLNNRLRDVHRKLDLTLECLDGLKEYLYEIDPQFDDERELNQELADSLDGKPANVFAGMEHMELIKRKESAGRRTLLTPFVTRV